VHAHTWIERVGVSRAVYEGVGNFSIKQFVACFATGFGGVLFRFFYSFF